MTTIFKTPEQTSKRDNPNGAPLPLVTPEGEALRQKSGPDNPFKLKIQNGGGGRG
jgi:hypothetical protein